MSPDWLTTWGEERCYFLIYTTTINETKPKSNCWEKLLNYRSNSFILSFLSVFLYVKLLVQRSPPPTWASLAGHAHGGAGFMAQGVAVIFHSLLQFCLDVIQAKSAKPKSVNNHRKKGNRGEVQTKNWPKEVYCLFVEYLWKCFAN